MPLHVVRRGDCISSIAEKNGFFWETVWLQNDALRRLRRDPNALLIGDEVTVADKELRQESGATSTTHVFKRRGVPVMLRLVMERDDVALANEDFILTVGGNSHSGTTDDSGFLEVPVPAAAKRARLRIADFEYELEIGAMDPIEETTGIQDRLRNLAFYEGEVDGDFGPMSRSALMEFQAAADIEPSGELDEATRQALESRHDLEHDSAQAPEQSEDEPGEEADSDSDADLFGDEPEEYDEDLELEFDDDEDDEPEMPDDETD